MVVSPQGDGISRVPRASVRLFVEFIDLHLAEPEFLVVSYLSKELEA